MTDIKQFIEGNKWYRDASEESYAFPIPDDRLADIALELLDAAKKCLVDIHLNRPDLGRGATVAMPVDRLHDLSDALKRCQEIVDSND